MTLAQIHTMLKGITGFDGKVAYRSFPVGKAPKLPFICYLDTNTSNFVADNKVYTIIQSIDIELYTKAKDVTTEGLVETELAKNNIIWNKYEQYLDDEQVYEVIYTISIDQ